MASAVNWVWWIRGIMAATFVVIEVERISVWVLSTLISAPFGCLFDPDSNT